MFLGTATYCKHDTITTGYIVDISCKQQRFLKHLTPLVVGLWLFVCVWCPLTHFKTHPTRPDAASSALNGSDSCAQCVLESSPLALAVVTVPLLSPTQSGPRIDFLPTLLSPCALTPARATRGPPTRLS